MLPGMLRSAPLAVIEKGVPEAAVKMPLTCQSPNTARIALFPEPPIVLYGSS